ncbi:hypothetical protein C8Q79DRAFT_781381 [Trametes meyenii]|nr:hypothetical protein C8Q79DRAFT_781381 [Trametes meyenii]
MPTIDRKNASSPPPPRITDRPAPQKRRNPHTCALIKNSTLATWIPFNDAFALGPLADRAQPSPPFVRLPAAPVSFPAPAALSPDRMLMVSDCSDSDRPRRTTSQVSHNIHQNDSRTALGRWCELELGAPPSAVLQSFPLHHAAHRSCRPVADAHARPSAATPREAHVRSARSSTVTGRSPHCAHQHFLRGGSSANPTGGSLRGYHMHAVSCPAAQKVEGKKLLVWCCCLFFQCVLSSGESL